MKFMNTLSATEIKLFIYYSVGVLLSRGSLFYNGLSIDDYTIGNTDYQQYYNNLTLSQGRIIFYFILNVLSHLTISVTSISFPFNFLMLFIQPLLVMSIFRFLQISNYRHSEWIALLSILHPYHTEILTFRAAPIIYTLSIGVLVFGLEYCINTIKISVIRLGAVLAVGFFTYQIILNYIIMICIMSYICTLLDRESKGNSQECKRRVTALAQSSILAMLVTWAIIAILTAVLGIELESRAQLMSITETTNRLYEIIALIFRVYWQNENIISNYIKIPLLIASILSIIIRIRSHDKSAIFLKIAPLILISLIFTPGVNILSRDWWPVSRTLNHISFLYGPLFLLGINSSFPVINRLIAYVVFLGCIGFGFFNLQIISDQSQINLWDRMLANRLVSRLEEHYSFNSLKFLYVHGGKWTYPNNIRTFSGDMNISAFYPKYSKIALINYVTGYHFLSPDTLRSKLGESYCLTVTPWPAIGSVTVVSDVGIICLYE